MLSHDEMKRATFRGEPHGAVEPPSPGWGLEEPVFLRLWLIIPCGNVTRWVYLLHNLWGVPKQTGPEKLNVPFTMPLCGWWRC